MPAPTAPKSRQQPTLAELIQVLDDGTTVADLLIAYGWVKKERLRHKAKRAKAAATVDGKPEFAAACLVAWGAIPPAATDPPAPVAEATVRPGAI